MVFQVKNHDSNSNVCREFHFSQVSLKVIVVFVFFDFRDSYSNKSRLIPHTTEAFIITNSNRVTEQAILKEFFLFFPPCDNAL